MTTAVAGARFGVRPTGAGRSEFAGTFRLLRLYLRRDRIVAPLWILLFSLPLGSVYITSIDAVYPTEAARAGAVTTIVSSPAQLAMYGPVYNTSVGAVGIWKAGMFHTLIAVATILTVIRHTRAEEETGRSEILGATALGRFANLTATLLFTLGGALLVGLLAASSLAGSGVPVAGSLAFGLGLAGSGMVFAGVAAVTAQVCTGARLARGLAFTVLAATYTLRAVGDAQAADGPVHPLTWLSPQGWSLQIRPFAGDRWWVLLLHATAVAVSITLAYALRRHRDLGAGLITERLGSPAAGPALAGPFGLATRLQWGTLFAWLVGLSLYALMIGGVVHGIADGFGDNEMVRDILTRMGGAESLEDAFLATAFTLLGVAGAVYAVSAALRPFGEEHGGFAEPVLSGAVGRVRWLASHLVFALGGPVVLMLSAGLLGGAVYGIASGDLGAKLPAVLAGALVQVPAMWLFAGITVALFGWLPRWTPVVWALLVAAIAVFLLGSAADAPQWFRNLEPFGHAPDLPGGEFSPVPVAVVTALAVLSIAVGLVGLRRRDIR